MSRCALLAVREVTTRAAPAGIAADALAAAMIEDAADLLQDLSGVDCLVVCPAEHEALVRRLVWSHVPIAQVADPTVRATLDVAAALGYDEGVVVTADAPDLPHLVLAKVFQALDTAPVAVAPCDGGGAVAVGARLPAPAWLGDPDLNAPDVVSELCAAAPLATDVTVTPAWHRLRRPVDVRQLDPELEGWEATRALLSGVRRPPEG